ncbi:MAG: acylneuraminate cytidylyltransferase family protein [Vicinamibacterales bacterium]
MRIIGIVPARGGSKGLPGKHLLPLAGRPLIAWTFDAALGSTTLGRVILSTDDERIAQIARGQGVDVPFMRPADLAVDETPMIDVLLHAIAELTAVGDAPDAVVLLQPTSPLRRAAHIDGAVRLLGTSGADAVVSVVPVPHRFNPVSVMRLEGDRLTPFAGGASVTRRQDKPLVYARNGPAVVAVRTRVLVDERSLYGRDTRALPMSEADSIDVDTEWDLAVAELALARRRAAG